MTAPPAARTRTSRIFYPTVTICAIGATLLAWWTMSHGAGISPDSAIYIGTARNLATGHGITFDGAPMNHFPPLYPLMLAAFGIVTGDATLAAKLIAALSFGGTVALIGAVVYVATERRIRAVVMVIAMFVVSGPVLYLNTMAWSESTFFNLALAGLLALAAWTVRGGLRMLALASTFFALAMMTRYVGITLLAPLAFAVLFLRQRGWLERLRDLAIAGMIACGPLALWMLRNAIVSPSATGRALVAHPVSATQLADIVTTLDDYVLPLTAGPWFKDTLFVAVGVLLVAGVRLAGRTRTTPDGPAGLGNALALLAGVFVAGYVGFLVLSVSFIDATTPFDDRILFPVFGMVVLVLVVVADRVALRHGRASIWWIASACAMISIGVRAAPAIEGLQVIHAEGVGYLSDTWRQSDMLAQVRQLSPELILYSNAQDAIEFLTGRVTDWLPEEEIWERMEPNPAFAGAREAICRQVRNGKAIVAYFTTDDPGDEWALNHTRELCDFSVVVRRSDGAFYSLAPVQGKSGAP